ncbi:MAG: branched-chain amino acid aminotransferase [Bacteroidetes bacterium]|nr:MAG: branched-chain amino acid aminotransferase [Bacteroidota bacterium]
MTDCTRMVFMANGELQPVAVFDDYFSPEKTYIYEVFRVIDGIPLFIEDHLDRFFETVRLAGADSGCKRNQLLTDILSVIGANGRDEGNIKISIAPGKSGNSNLLIYYTPHIYPTAQQFASGVAVKLMEAERNNPNAKVMDMPLRAVTDKIKSQDEVYEVLLVDRKGYITEGSRSNVFFISGDEVITPPLESVLPGITRKQIISLCEASQIRVSETVVHRNDLKKFDALFISGTSRKVLPVNRVDEQSFDVNNSQMKRIADLFSNHVASYLKSHRPG